MLIVLPKKLYLSVHNLCKELGTRAKTADPIEKYRWDYQAKEPSNIYDNIAGRLSYFFNSDRMLLNKFLLKKNEYSVCLSKIIRFKKLY